MLFPSCASRANSISRANPCCPIEYVLPSYRYSLFFGAPTNGKSTGDVLPQYSGSPHHIYSLPSALRFTDLISAPNDSISTRSVSFSKIYLMLHLSLPSYSSQLLTVLGNGMTSRMLDMPVRYITQRSNPSPNPACLAEPYFLRSR